MRAIGYFSAFPAQKGAPADRSTLSQQNDDFLAFCAAHGYEPAASFLDSGAKDEPAGLRQLLHYLHEPEKGFLTVVVANFARLGPTPPAAARAYFQITARGAGVTSIADGVLDEARLLRLWTGVQGNGRMGDRVRDAMRRRALQGQVLGRPPYGYRVGPQRRLEIVEDEATLVRYIARLYLDEDLGVRRIAKRLNGEGLRTRRDGPWSMVTIRDLLRNRVYVGTYTRFGARVPGSHPAIIAEKDFRTIQERMDSRRRPAVPVQRGRFLLSGLVICGENGARMIGVTRRQRWARRNGEVVRNTYRYYQSQARTNQSIGGYYTRRAGELEAEIRRHLTGDAPGAVRPCRPQRRQRRGRGRRNRRRRGARARPPAEPPAPPRRPAHPSRRRPPAPRRPARRRSRHRRRLPRGRGGAGRPRPPHRGPRLRAPAAPTPRAPDRARASRMGSASLRRAAGPAARPD